MCMSTEPVQKRALLYIISCVCPQSRYKDEPNSRASSGRSSRAGSDYPDDTREQKKKFRPPCPGKVDTTQVVFCEPCHAQRFRIVLDTIRLAFSDDQVSSCPSSQPNPATPHNGSSPLSQSRRSPRPLTPSYPLSARDSMNRFQPQTPPTGAQMAKSPRYSGYGQAVGGNNMTTFSPNNPYALNRAPPGDQPGNVQGSNFQPPNWQAAGQAPDPYASPGVPTPQCGGVCPQQPTACSTGLAPLCPEAPVGFAAANSSPYPAQPLQTPMVPQQSLQTLIASQQSFHTPMAPPQYPADKFPAPAPQGFGPAPSPGQGAYPAGPPPGMTAESPAPFPPAFPAYGPPDPYAYHSPGGPPPPAQAGDNPRGQDPYALGNGNDKVLFCAPACLVQLDKKKNWREVYRGYLKVLQRAVGVGFSLLLESPDGVICSHHFISRDMTFEPSCKTQYGFCFSSVARCGSTVKGDFLVSFQGREQTDQFRQVVSECQRLLRLTAPNNTGRPDVCMGFGNSSNCNSNNYNNNNNNSNFGNSNNCNK
ncbi:protein enabled homolog [Aplysia californica]|uniref:Protein enabled homolog n=1 Tax=Aplysia californica TaxID=6500 RepID=A0ABM1A3N9_APLCA|nr:protein enabled homolog [Aplysia californica]